MFNGILIRRWVVTVCMCLSVVPSASATAQLPNLDQLSEDEQRQVQIAERFLTVLERNPRRGTALDRIYGHHIEFGTLDEFLQSFHKRVADSPDDGVGWMLLGLFEAHRGNDADAVAAFEHAEKLRPEDAIASYYLGQSLLLIGEPEKAIAAFERAIARKPPRTDLLEIFQQLGRVHQRAQRQEAAQKVWQRLEELFPDDPRVQEQIAITLVEEGEYAQALPRYEKLAELVKDDYRRTMFRIEAAELKIRVSDRENGLADLETLLDDLNPEGWLHRDVRRRIEDVFLRAGDQDGLVKYYENWLEKHPDDVDGMARLSRFLAEAARLPEAGKWIEKAIERAPTRIALRKTYIDQLVDNQQYGEAISQYKRLLDAAPGNVDFLREWGRVVLKNKEAPAEQRRAEAARIWNRILATRPDDALTHAQVADLFRQSNFTDEALKLYEKAVTLSPADPQYREYLGEYYHILKRSDEALETWKSIAEGDRRSVTNVARLAEVYNSFGYLDQAVDQISQATKLDPKDFALQLKSAEYHNRAGKYDEALTFVAAAEKLAANEEESDAVLTQRIDIFQTSRRLDDEIDTLVAELTGNDDATAAKWHVLARYYEAGRRWASSLEALDQALAIDPKSIPVLSTSARVAEMSGDYARASGMNRHLAEVDRRSRGDHLMNVARLEAQLGRTEAALEAGRELIVSAPGNTEHYEFYAQLCFRLGENEQGLDSLRKAVRINPNEPALITALGAALSDQLRTDEAIEVYWRAFEKSDDLDDKTTLTVKLTELHLQINQFDKLIERLGRDRREDDKRREMTICLAQAHHTSGDYGTARSELESLLQQETRDTNLLQQLSKLCEQGSDMRAAIEYQRQLVEAAPGHETEYRLATLLQQNGEHDAAAEIYLRLTQREEDPIRMLRNLDSLMRQQSFESVIAVTDPLLSEQRDDWELLYREAVAWNMLENPAEARVRLERLLAINESHEELGVVAQDKLKRDQARARSNNLRGIQSNVPQRQSPLEMLRYSSQVLQAVGLSNDRYYGSSSQQQPIWTPESFGVARMAAYGWLIKFDQDEALDRQDGEVSKLEQRFNQLEAEALRPDCPRPILYDWLYVEQLRTNLDSVFEIAKRLARDGGNEERTFYLNSLRSRHLDAEIAQQQRNSNQPLHRDPLSEEDLELMLSCYNELIKQDAEGSRSAGFVSSQVAYDSNGNMYVQINNQWVMVGRSFSGGGMHLPLILEELRLAGRDEQARKMIDEKLASAESAEDLSAAMSLAFQEERYEELQTLYQKWLPAAREKLAQAVVEKGRRQTNAAELNPLGMTIGLLVQWMGSLGPEEEHEQILAILDPALDLAIEQLKKQRLAQSLNRRTSISSSAGSIRSTYINFHYGKENNQNIRIQTIAPVSYTDSSAMSLMGQVYETFKKNKATEDFGDYLQARQAKTDDANRPYEQVLQANYLWWQEQQEDALILLTNAAGQFSEDPEFTLHLAGLHEMLRNYDESLELLEGIAPRDQKLLQAREIAVLQLAERVGDIDRARQAAERLFGLRLNTQTQLGLVDRMRRLGLHDLAESVISRAERRSSNQASSLISLMTLYQGQGKTELATQIAHRILRQSQPPAIQTSRYYRSGSSSNTAGRSQALRVLQQTGELKKLIERIEGQLEKSPRSPQFYLQLLEFYGVQNEREKIVQILETALENRPDALEFRFKLAQHFESMGKNDEACDQYLAVFAKKPAWIVEDFYQFRNLFTRAKRQQDLAKALSETNLKSIGSPYYVVDLVADMINDQAQNPNTAEMNLLVELAAKCFDAYPSYRTNLLQRLYRNEVWKNDRIFELGKQAIVPGSTKAARNPWYGVDQISSYSSGGQANVMVHRLMSGIKNTPHMQELERAVEAGIAASPEWKGGEAVLALIELETGRNEPAKERLQKLMSDETVMKSMPTNAGWIIGQELDKFNETRELARQLLELAVENNKSQNEFMYTPVARLIEVYAKTGRKEQARDMLLEQLAKGPQNRYDAQYSAYQKTRNELWAAQKLLEFEMPIDSLRLSQSLVTDSDGTVQIAAQWNSSNYTQQAKVLLKQALSKINVSNADRAVAQLLTVPEKRNPNVPLLDLMLKTPTVQTVRTETFDSGLLSILKSVSESETISQEISHRLKSLREQFPDELSVRVTAGLFALEQDDPQIDAVLSDLQAFLSEHPLEEIKAGRRPNSRQRKEALGRVPLWLVARKCLTESGRKARGEVLAAAALEGARRQVDNEFSIAILYDWGKLALEAGDKKQAEEKWNELLELVTKRPGESDGKPPATSQLLDVWDDRFFGRFRHFDLFSQPVAWQETPRPAPQKQAARGIPPLTISQFRIAIEISTAAAENSMPELSRNALREAVAGGMPVPDLASSNSNTNSGFTSVSPASTSGLGQSSQFESEVASSLEKVIGLWSGSEYPPREVYNLLVPVVFPEHRPSEILMYADSSGLMNEQIHSLGAILAEWTHRANQEEDFKRRIAERSDIPVSQVAGRVLLTRLAIAEKKYEIAEQQLTALSETITNTPQVEIISLACHAALPAAVIPELEEATFPILKKTVEQLVRQNSGNSSSTLSLGKLVSRVNRQLARRGELEPIENFFSEYQIARQQHYSRYSGDYGLRIQWQDMGALADEAAKIGVPSLALDYMGRTVDFDLVNTSQPSMKVALTLVCRDFKQQSAEERFQIWSDWTLPTENRRTVRVLAEWVPPLKVPERFLPEELRTHRFPQTDLLSNLTELIAAARESGHLEDLRASAQAAYDEKLPGAEFLMALMLIELDDIDAGKPVIQPLIDTVADRNKRESGQSIPDLGGDYLVYRACLDSTEFSKLYANGRGKMKAAFRSANKGRIGANVDIDFLQREIGRTKTSLRHERIPELIHWTSVPSDPNRTDAMQPWWIVQEGHLNYLSGTQTDLLFFNYPLVGEFEITADCYCGGWKEVYPGYGGVLVESTVNVSQMYVKSYSDHDTFYLPQGLKRLDDYNRITVRREKDGQTHHLLNGHPVYSERSLDTAPWFSLNAHGYVTSSARRIEFSGEPVIPREVKLFSGNRMDGWNTRFFSESQPRHRIMAQNAPENSSAFRQQRNEPADHDWKVTDGILLARPLPQREKQEQSWNFYARPLLEGESFRYEFFYVPEKFVGHPTIGRTALLLEPEGVAAHWIVDSSLESFVAGVPLDNRIVEHDCRRGPAGVPLKEGEWNQVSMTREGGSISLTLNDTLIYERPLDDGIVPRFGLFRYKQQGVRVRNAILTGPWPEKLTDEIRSQLLATKTEIDPAGQRIVSRLLPNELFAADASEIVAKAKSSTPEEAYALLSDWVLLTDEHRDLRLYYERKSIGPEEDRTDFSDPLESFLCPAIELVRVAEELGRLSDLRQTIDKIQTYGDRALRAKRALATLAAIQAGDDEIALLYLKTFYDELKKGLPENRTVFDRASHYIAALYASTRPALQSAALDIAFVMRENQRKKASSDDFKQEVEALVGKINTQTAELTAYPGDKLTQWEHVPYFKTETSAKGWQPSNWRFDRGVVQQIPGETWSQLYFQSPLKGNFELVFERSLHGYRELAVAYGMHAAEPLYNYEHVRVNKVMHGTQDVGGKLEILPHRPWLAEFRVVVEGNKVTTYIEDHKLHEQTLAPGPDPWVVIQSSSPGNDSWVRNLRILGQPEIPDEISLIDIWDWAALRADHYGDWFTVQGEDPNVPWIKVGDEIRGQRRSDRSAKNRQCLLSYQRPMLEDGTISFEMYYVPGEFEVHPALGNRAFLLDPKGVRGHQLTNGEYETSDLAPDNSFPLPAAEEAVPLKENDWNSVKLTLKGDTLTVSVNDKQAARFEIPSPRNRRNFGLFRYSDQTQSRVRNVVYRGDWPKVLPAVEEQELAYPPRGPYADLAAGWETVLDLKSPQAMTDLKPQGVTALGSPRTIAVSKAGLQFAFNMPDQELPEQKAVPQLVYEHPIAGDCQITADFSGLTLGPAKDWGNGLKLRVEFEGGAQNLIDMSVDLPDRKNRQLRANCRRISVSGESTYHTFADLRDVSEGRLRAIRHNGYLHCLYAEKNTDKFELVGTYLVGSDPIKRIKVLFDTADPDAMMSAVIERVTIQSDPEQKTLTSNQSRIPSEAEGK